MGNYSDDPGYDALRLGADWASAVRGNTIYFDYEDGQVEITPPPPTAPAGAVPVATPTLARSRPRVRSIKLTTAEYGSITLPSTSCSAAFWSESAVEKFLLPYYASAAGSSAQAVLQAIGSAWYAYKDRAVCALTFQYSPKAMVGPLSLWNTVGVVYGTTDRAGNPVLRALPLPEYLGKGPWLTTTTMVVPEIPRSTKAAASNGQATPVDCVGAREVAEYVNGLAGHPVMVYRSEQEVGGLEAMLTSQKGQSSTPLFSAYTSLVRPDRPKVWAEMAVEVEEWPDGPKKEEWFPLTMIGGSPANDPDSAFWTDGAVEMLMLPYYASVEGYGAPWYLMLLLGKWAGDIPADIVDAIELVPQIVKVLQRVLREPRAETEHGIVKVLEGEPEQGLFTTNVFGLVHLPRSEYMDEGVPLGSFVHLPRSEYMDEGVPLESITLESRTWLLTTDGHHPLVSPRRRLVPPRGVTG